ncbi:MAG: phosphate ABC transporter, permease protein PstA, partial [Candidatus Latescibacterota bacterium]
MTLRFWRGGDPFIWLTGSALAFCLLMISGLVGIILYNGVGVFWPSALEQLSLRDGQVVLGKVVDRQVIPDQPESYRIQLKVGNRDAYGLDFRWVDEADIERIEQPAPVVVFERLEWGDAYGYLEEITQDGQVLAADGQDAWKALQPLLEASAKRWEIIRSIEHEEMGELNRAMEDLRLEKRRLEMDGAKPEAMAELEDRDRALWERYERVSERLNAVRAENERAAVSIRLADGRERSVRVADIVRTYQPNALGVWGKIGIYCEKGWEFVAGQPRESNTEGGIFPALFGTVMMVMLMSL